MPDLLKNTTSKQKILAATASLIAERGYHQVKTSHIVNAVDVSDTLIFKYYGSLNNLHREVCKNCIKGISNFSMDAGISTDKEFLESFTLHFYEQHNKEPESVLLYLRTLLEKTELLTEIPNNTIEGGALLELQFRFSTYYGDEDGEFYFQVYWKYLLFDFLEHKLFKEADEDLFQKKAGILKNLFF